MLRFREAFETCVARLHAVPQIAVTHCWLGAPATDQAIAEAEAAIGPLPATLRAFYKQCDGAQLRWIDRESPEFDADDDKPLVTTYDWLVEGNDRSADGVIHLLPLRGLCEDRDGEEEEGVRSFDVFGASSGTVALVCTDGRGGRGALTTSLSFGSDSNACWDRCDIELAAYLEAVLGCYGHIDRRIDLLVGRAKAGWTLPLRRALPRGPAADQVRVQWSDPAYGYAVLRGTLVSSEGDELRIASDLWIPGFSERIVVRERRRTQHLATPGDAYELARSAPAAFLRALTEVSPAAARGMFASVRGDVRGLHRDPRFPTTFSPSVFMVLALFAEVEAAAVFAAFAALLRRWMLVPVTEHAAYGPVDDLAEAITALLVTRSPRPSQDLRQLVDEALLFARKRPAATDDLRPLAAHIDYWRRRLHAD